MKHLFILLFTACTLLTYAQVPEGYPANYAKAPRFKALVTALFWILLPIFQNTHTRN